MNCPICDSILTLKNCVNTECGHSFCNTCFWKWTKEHNTCALCRSSILVNSEELEEQTYIRQMIVQRSELSIQIQFFENKHLKIKEEYETLRKQLNSMISKTKSSKFKNYIKKITKQVISNTRLNNTPTTTCISNYEINAIRIARLRGNISHVT